VWRTTPARSRNGAGVAAQNPDRQSFPSPAVPSEVGPLPASLGRQRKGTQRSPSMSLEVSPMKRNRLGDAPPPNPQACSRMLPGPGHRSTLLVDGQLHEKWVNRIRDGGYGNGVHHHRSRSSSGGTPLDQPGESQRQDHRAPPANIPPPGEITSPAGPEYRPKPHLQTRITRFVRAPATNRRSPIGKVAAHPVAAPMGSPPPFSHHANAFPASVKGE